MDAITKFKEAALELQKTDECIAYNEARKAYDNDAELQTKIGEFNLLRLDLNNEMSKDPQDTSKIDALNMQTSKLYNEILESKSMLALNSAKENVEQLINYVNVIINTAIDGGNPMDVEEPADECDCSGGCGGCGGSCH